MNISGSFRLLDAVFVNRPESGMNDAVAVIVDHIAKRRGLLHRSGSSDIADDGQNRLRRGAFLAQTARRTTAGASRRYIADFVVHHPIQMSVVRERLARQKQVVY